MSRLESIGAIAKSYNEDGQFISHIFTRTKSNGKTRIILNLKPLNKFVKYTHFKMEHLEHALLLINAHDWFCSLDLADAFFSVSIHPSHWKFLKFIWNDTLWEYRVMVFGLSQAPYVFTKLCKPLLAVLRDKHLMRCSMYLDDLLLIGKSKNELLANTKIAQDLFHFLGFNINVDKSSFEPSRCITHLGFLINSTDMSISIPLDKTRTLQAKCAKLLKLKDNVCIRTVASVIGSLVAYCKGIKYGRLHYRCLERAKMKALKLNKGDFDASMSLSTAAIENILFWLSDCNYLPVSFKPTKFPKTIISDASNEGWGGHFLDKKAGGRWLDTEKSFHINWLELKACWLCLKSFASNWTETNIALKLDNMCAVQYINNQGGTIESLDLLTKSIWNWCALRNIHIQASYIPGKDNIIADFQSRNFKDNTEWCLADNAFNQIIQTFGSPDVDLFASRTNYKLQPYVSWQPDPNSFAVDAFCLDWAQFKLCYAFPPFALLGKVLHKVINDNADMLLIAPKWRTQFWFPMLHHLLVEEPYKLPEKPDTVFLAHNPKLVHPIWDKLHLFCFRISGKR